jgi:hypothetical protein
VFTRPFIGREEAVLQLTMLLYQNGVVEDSAEIVNIMNAFPAGKEDEMHTYVNTQLKSYTQLKNKKELDAATAAATAAQPSVGATSLLAATAAVAKNSPTPVEYGPVELDVDNEVHSDDDYMPPPDASGNKRGLQIEK